MCVEGQATECGAGCASGKNEESLILPLALSELLLKIHNRIQFGMNPARSAPLLTGSGRDTVQVLVTMPGAAARTAGGTTASRIMHRAPMFSDGRQDVGRGRLMQQIL